MRVPVVAHGIVGIQFEGVLELRFRSRPVPFMVGSAVSQRGMCFGQVAIKLQCLGHRLLCFSHRFDWRQCPVLPRPQRNVAVGESARARA
jgi:hypothetical protein